MSEVQKSGDWVIVRAKVVELHPNGRDLGLEFFSKTDQWQGWVRRDLCEPAQRPIRDEPGVGSAAMVNGQVFQHVTGGWLGVGDDEPSTWEDLHWQGDVEVIHHA